MSDVIILCFLLRIGSVNRLRIFVWITIIPVICTTTQSVVFTILRDICVRKHFDSGKAIINLAKSETLL